MVLVWCAEEHIVNKKEIYEMVYGVLGALGISVVCGSIMADITSPLLGLVWGGAFLTLFSFLEMSKMTRDHNEQDGSSSTDRSKG